MDHGNASAERANPWLLLFIVTPVYFFTMFYRMAPSVMAGELAADFGVAVAELSGISSMTFIAYGLMHLPSGLLVDALGARKAIGIVTLLAAAGNGWFACSGSLSEAAAARFVLGLGCAVCVPCSAMLARSFSSENFGTANSLFLTCGMLGTVCAGTPLLLACEALGWRRMTLVCGALSLLFALVCWMTLPEAAAGPRKSLKAQCADLARGMWRVAACRSFWPLTLWFSLAIGVYFCMGGMWWAPCLIQGCGMSPDDAGRIISLSYILALPGQYVLIRLSDTLRSRRKVMMGSTALALAAMLSLSLWGDRMGFFLLVLQGGIFANCCGTLGAIAFVAAKELFPVSMAGTAIGMLQTLPYLAATPLCQALFGKILAWRLAAGADGVTAYAHAGGSLLAVLGLALFMAFAAKETFGRRTEKQGVAIPG